MKLTNEQLKLAADTVRCLSADMIEKAKSGHPGAPLGMADLAVSLWLKFLKVDPKEPTWTDRDRLVFSGGHASALVYSLFHLSGMGNLGLDELKNFRQFEARTAGHPERGLLPGVEVTTGPLGQGLAMSVGLALAERMEASRDGEEIVDHRTWCFCGDGDIEEGISHEAASLAGYLKLNRLVAIYDSNGITIEGSTGLTLADNTKLRFESYGWKVFEIDGHDFDAIDRVLRKAMKVESQPVLIIAKTHIGFGAPTKQDSADSHGAPLGADEVAGLKKNLGFDPEKSFHIPYEVYDLFEDRAAATHRSFLRWRKTMKEWKAANPEKAQARELIEFGAIPADLASKLPVFDSSKSVATRAACGDVMNATAPLLPSLVGGSADLGPSNKTYLKGYGDIAPGDYSGRNIRFGVREFAMSALVNGMVAHGGFRAYAATFFVFCDYCRPAIRLAALMKIPSLYIFSHDSFYVGEDGPTHEPVEHLAAMRCIPNVTVFRPADANETSAVWMAALANKEGPSCILTTRQNVPVLEGVSADKVAKGGYVIWESGQHPEILFISSGSEVSLAIDAAKQLAELGREVRVVSMPSRELFEKQSLEYRESVIPGTVARRVIVEAASRFGWEAYSVNNSLVRYVTLDHYGSSAPYKVLAEAFGFTVENVLAKAKELF
jgi:transketolase